MKSAPVSPILAREFAAGQPTFKLEGHDGWLKTLNVGQIIKGRIMRQYDDGRYGVHFSGQERIVDSAVALTVGEILSGRVIGVAGEIVSVKITKQELGVSEDQRNVPIADEAAVTSAPSFVTRHSTGVTLTPAAQEVVEKVARGLDYPEIVSKVGLYLTKLGLPVTQDLLHALYERIQRSPGTATVSGAEEVKKEEAATSMDPIDGQVLAVQSSVIQILAESFRTLRAFGKSDDGEEKAGDKQRSLEHEAILSESMSLPISSDSGRRTEDFLLSRLLSHIINIQTGAVYQHKFETLPILVDGRLMEFDVALFDHAQSHAAAGVQSKRLRFSLQTHMGLIQLDVTIFNQRVQLQLIAEKSWVAKEFEEYRNDVSDSLREAGWQVDTLEYRSNLAQESPMRAVIDHVLAQESLGLTV